MAEEKRPGIFVRTGRVVKRVGGFYLWTVAGNLQERKDELKRIKEGVHAILHRKYRTETFADAIARKGLSSADLEQRAKTLAAYGFLYGLITLIAIVFLFATPLSPRPINHALMSSGVAIVAGTKVLAIRFRVAQIRARSFFEFKEWLWGKKGGR
ncbi:hypothetical protein [Chromobacterium haemolyticum]|uniref:hypothetical protein n=1 Tax=Chromobacterium haemolyticum TaxID=394935 RepID=UPI0024469265|nr:hypothetical protein [Chromobacterium haemolyticum]MDH0342146.1 hypothetical protein [Chromobacterium haemolyticum]